MTVGYRITNREYSSLRIELERDINRKTLEEYLYSRNGRETTRQAIEIVLEFLISYYSIYNNGERDIDTHYTALNIASRRALWYAEFIGIREGRKNYEDSLVKRIEEAKGRELKKIFGGLFVDKNFLNNPIGNLYNLLKDLKKGTEQKSRVRIDPRGIESLDFSVQNNNGGFLRASEIEEKEIRVIGNKDALEKVRNLVLLLSTYDPEEAYSPIRRVLDYPIIIDLYGEPGSGKTHLVKYAEQLLRNIYNEKGIDTLIKYITMNEFSSYINKSAKNLESLFETIRNSNDRYLIVIDEFETMFFSTNRNNDEDTKVTGVLRRILGDTSREKGNWAMIITSNADLSEDSRLEPQIRSRLRGGAVYVPGVQTVEEYIELFKYKASKGLKYGYFKISKEEISLLAERMHSLGFSGRDVEKVVEKASFKAFNETALGERDIELIVNKLNHIYLEDFEKIIQEILETTKREINV
ncbi:AAA family ATPase [Candidatus Woesearchaeota archaeon]|nr:AAA family ATPase [Candidatus Woesearchaeota archaeon]